MKTYLDNGATTFPKPEQVYLAMDNYMRNNGCSAGRGNYALARQADEIVYGTRKALAKLLGIKKVGQIVFTNNATESLNLVLKGFLKTNDEVLTTNIEHNAMWRPLKSLEQKKNIHINSFHCSQQGEVNLNEVKEKINAKTKLVAIVHGSNVLGNILPLSEIITLAHEKNVPVLVDAAQTAGVYPISIEELDVDFFAFTGHKGLLGPMGTGGIYIKEGLKLETFKEGGTGSLATSPFQPDSMPDRFEAGTQNIVGLAGLKAAAEFLLETTVSKIRSHEEELTALLLEGLQKIPGVDIYGPQKVVERLGIVSFNIKNQSPYDLAFWLDKHHGLMLRAGLHCSPQAHRLIGTENRGAIRAGLGYFNKAHDIEKLLESLKEYIYIQKG